jgi:hypothetical protein
MKTVLLTFVAMLVGAACVLLAPSELVLVPVVAPFVLCILLAWYVAFQNKALRVTPVRWFSWPWVNTSAPLRRSRALWSLYASAAIGVGGCLGLLLHV